MSIICDQYIVVDSLEWTLPPRSRSLLEYYLLLFSFTSLFQSYDKHFGQRRGVGTLGIHSCLYFLHLFVAIGCWSSVVGSSTILTPSGGFPECPAPLLSFGLSWQTSAGFSSPGQLERMCWRLRQHKGHPLSLPRYHEAQQRDPFPYFVPGYPSELEAYHPE